MMDYAKGEFPLIKLHGSMNWAHEIRNFSPQNLGSNEEMISEIIDRTPSLDIDNESYRIVHEDPFARQRIPLFPALAIPVENKSRYECPRDHVKTLEDCLPHVERLLIIGWKAAENTLLKTMAKSVQKKTRVMIVSSNHESALDVIHKLTMPMEESNVKPEYYTTNGGFSNFIFSKELDDFLR